MIVYQITIAKNPDPTKPDNSTPKNIPGISLVWNDEFNKDGKPDVSSWRYETGFVRNEELQWYQIDNATCKDGVLIIEGRKQQVTNPNYQSSSTDWKLNRQYASYTSSSINTSGKKSWLFGHFEIRARINTQSGSWPAIWTLGETGEWPSNGEIDILEFYRISGVPSILANVAWGTSTRWVAKWDGANKPLSYFTATDTRWNEKFHIWTMDWSKDSIKLYVDNVLMNETALSATVNPDGKNPFLQQQYILLNLALGGNGGDPSQSIFPVLYEVDYVRVYQHSTEITGTKRQSNLAVIPCAVSGEKLIISESINSYLEKNAAGVTLCNTTGAQQKTWNITGSKTGDRVFNISQFSHGIYMVFFSGLQVKPQKIIIK